MVSIDGNRMTHILSFIRKHYVAVGILLIAVVTALWFAGGLLMEFVYFNDPSNKDKDLKPWMSPRYIGLSYDIPRPLVAKLLGLQVEDLKGQTLGRIALDRGLTMQQLTDNVRDGVEAFRAVQP